MSLHARRRFVAGMGAAFAVGTMSLAVRAAMGPDDKFDLVIKGGELLDPGQKLRAKRDIGIRAGRIEAIEADIPVTRASRLLDALVTGMSASIASIDRKSTRLNSSHSQISYAVFCLKKKKRKALLALLRAPAA